ncbi:malate dehydrogenase (oxaloacetate-decarboxylating)(NADP+) [Hymenobacter luteus]|uniref:Malate dehydrogenase (Oxaloacetate-decarboxylating)(NADP+) n=2 Tax=Hymenobacter TaxID=89966 RepID=A0A7W9SZJ7_9BACT|nr:MULTISPECIES: NADP-dependent malic enzyme [Hymenobacter]MBB4599846.1 malate dehydrogenase (oxaloacetate-decarboxylating)(NADP+) [Hymenobacter latericoloratus]MBB6057844.1 malate dehydrogenase (oxaloacetate-decarboxylating)(NADP+) [Hymenobacter luteus]
MLKINKQDALNYHSQSPAGKIEVIPTKPVSTQLDLALAYSPGVAEPCKAIAANKDDVYKYTAKGNLVGVISNGTAVLGLGNIGPDASKPVMEGKGVLFKKFAGIDCFDIEIDATDPEEFIRIVKSLEPTFGGINLEDIKAPECFPIETALREQMNIPLMHDDQHGTAIISSAALLNALEVVGKKIDEIQVVVSGAGAAAISCLRLYLELGLKRENVVVFDKDGIINPQRTDLAALQMQFATQRDITSLAQAMEGADFFLGLSAANVLAPELLLKMAANPIVFALANPDPEIAYDLALATRQDIIMATGRSDHPNQVNNVLGFPYIFRGALDVRATEINEAMKLAAVHALAELAKEPVPDMVNKAYGDNTLSFGRTYLIPKPLDPRLITTVSPAVAKAAMESGVARTQIDDWFAYEDELRARLGVNQKLMNRITQAARSNPKRVVFAEGDTYKILKAAQILHDEGIAQPILLGNRNKIARIAAENSLDLEGCQIIDILHEEAKREEYAQKLYEKRQRRGITLYEGRRLLRERNYFGSMMLETGEADAFITGLSKDYGKSIVPSLQVIGVAESVKRVASMYIIQHKKGPYFFADTTVNIDPSAEEMVEIIGLTSRAVKFFDTEPRVGVISYSNFGSNPGELPDKARRATELAKQRYPDLILDGEMQANTALNPELLREQYPFSPLADKGGANTLIFPNVISGNIAYKVIQEIGGAEVIGPILMGMRKPVHILQLGASVREIVNMAAIAVVDAQHPEGKGL